MWHRFFAGERRLLLTPQPIDGTRMSQDQAALSREPGAVRTLQHLGADFPRYAVPPCFLDKVGQERIMLLPNPEHEVDGSRRRIFPQSRLVRQTGLAEFAGERLRRIE